MTQEQWDELQAEIRRRKRAYFLEMAAAASAEMLVKVAKGELDAIRRQYLSGRIGDEHGFSWEPKS